MRDESQHDRGHGERPHHGPGHHNHHEGRPSEPHRPHGGRGGRHDGEHFEGPRGRARRGEARYILLDALRDGPKHGYEIIKALEDRSGGQYAPSPGTVYPTMQYLEELGLVRAAQEAERRIFHLTEAGTAELSAQAAQIRAFWARFAETKIPDASRREADYLKEEWESLSRAVWGGLRLAIAQGDAARILQVRQILVRCREEVRATTADQKGETHA